MDPRALLLALLSTLPLTHTCALSPAPSSANGERAFTSSDAGGVHSLLSRQAASDSEHLFGVSELSHGKLRLVEDVTLDANGTLKRLEAVLTRAGDTSEKHVLIDAEQGMVEVTDSARHLHWQAPRDYPWLWAPLLTTSADDGRSAPVMTPLEARVAWRASAAGRTVRLLDLGTLTSFTSTADQVATREGDAGTVVLGDDTSEMEQGMPTSLHLAALNVDLALDDPAQTPSALLAVAGSTAPRGLFAR
jgi:hypothetical protein